MQLVVDGKANKVIGIELDISERPVELHRSRIMKKMGCAHSRTWFEWSRSERYQACAASGDS